MSVSVMKAGAEIAVHCAHARMAAIESLVPHPRNPNTHPDAQIALLAKIIAAQGWRNPIVISRRSGFIVAGHARLLAARVLDVDAVPVDEQEFENEAMEWAHLIADNRIAELAEKDYASLSSFVADLSALDNFDITLTGIPDAEIENLLRADWTPPQPSLDGGASHDMTSVRVTHEQLAIIQRALEKVRRSHNDLSAASDGRCLELICAEYLA